jgi:hypothetical protein
MEDLMAAKISKIIISIGGDDKTLTLDEARELRNALNDLLGTPWTSPAQIIERIVYPSWPRYYGPYWTMTASGTHENMDTNGAHITYNTTGHASLSA